MNALENEKGNENTVAFDFSEYDSSKEEKHQKVIKRNYNLTRIEANHIRVATKGWGSTVKIIGNILEDKWFDYESFFDDMKNDTADDKGTEVIWRRNT